MDLREQVQVSTNGEPINVISRIHYHRLVRESHDFLKRQRFQNLYTKDLALSLFIQERIL